MIRCVRPCCTLCRHVELTVPLSPVEGASREDGQADATCSARRNVEALRQAP